MIVQRVRRQGHGLGLAIPQEVDLVTRRQMEQGKPARRSQEILSTARILYHA